MNENLREFSNEHEGITLIWKNLSVYTSFTEGNLFSGRKRRHKRIINNVTGSVKAGSLVALMGPSGSGKSTLMSTLANRSSNDIYTDGEILVNGAPISAHLNKISGYMHQEDLFIGSLTVREHLTIMVWLKRGRNETSSNVSRIVTDLLSKVGLSDSGGKKIGLGSQESLLSGGERKKLAFATEMITNPRVFFCDEPTTGLDSYSAQSIVQLMKSMARENKTILCTIHQPSSEVFDMFDHLILLVEGRIAFIGSSSQTLEYFQRYGYVCPPNYNPAEFLIRTLSKDISAGTLNRLCDEFIVSDKGREIDKIEYEAVVTQKQTQETTRGHLSAGNRDGSSWSTKLYWLTYRSSLQIMRDPSVQVTRIIQKLAIAFTAGLCFAGSDPLSQSGIQSVEGAVFLFVTENTFPGMYAILSMFPQELPLFLREHRNGCYTSDLFYISKIMSLLPGLIVEPFLFVLVLYWLAGLRKTLYAFSITVLMAILTMNVATACGSLFSNAFESITVAMACLVPFDNMLMITSGLFINLDSLPFGIKWFQYVSWFMYSNEAAMIAQWDGVQNISCHYTNPDVPCLTKGSDVLDMFGFSPSHLYYDILAIVVMCILFHILACFFLWRKTKTKYS